MKNYLRTSKLAVSVFLFAFILSAQAALNVSSYNIRNFDYDERSHTPTNKAKLAQTIKEINPDLLGVQEINQTREFKDFIQREFFGKYETSLTECGGGGDQKLGFVYNRSKLELLSFKEDRRVMNPYAPHQTMCDLGSRPLALGKFKVSATGQVFVAIAVHLKAGGQYNSVKKRFRQLELLSEVIQEQREQGVEKFVVMGDFNSTRYSHDPNIRAKFLKVVEQMGLKDVTANIGCTSYWWGGRPDGRQYPSHLDHILVSPNFGKASQAAARAYGHCAKLSCAATQENEMGVSFDEVSDHCPIATSI